jgi:hypothetical protein
MARPTPATVQRTVPGKPAVTASPAMSLASEASSSPPIQRSADTPQGETGAVAVSLGIAHRDADGAVVFARAPSSPPTPNVQRAAEPIGASVDSQPAGPADGSTAEAIPPVPAPGVRPDRASGALDIDDLARRLYDPLAARLKAELRLDRERAGLITDLRRP